METAARVPDAHHTQQAPVEPMAATGPAPTVGTNVTATATTATAGQTQEAPGYIQSARETLASIAGTVQNAVGIETPSSTLHDIANNAKIEASMPSTETSGAKPGERVGGVGSLPGDNKEEGVARLPAERTSVPSREHEGNYPGEKSGGVGALPGALNESGVALLPDERGTQVKAGVESSTRAAAHPSSEHPDKQDLKTAAAHPVETAKQARRGSTSSLSSSDGEQDPNAPKRKTTLKNKVAGGMKAAVGKIKKDEEMYAEGQAQRGH
ncbi:hypothetical protein RSOLAG1IB_01763 [Rhizoctonia solani AG-1 IB]|uniref:CsbD domain-containing protein n=1 Tax=Thanatephorus cucumeris (strain AG1-IB / isolate 7/3/14) TaxID=1108050 RepID=M5BXW8_THACB|nr:hypothetical protein BN14_05487 [Rhizoctonia solani AG-1 IB]CEL55751.1 hypothetical protein RSOLAG1IB_01763 [Rhizoctonia solani AG-1 IB]